VSKQNEKSININTSSRKIPATNNPNNSYFKYKAMLKDILENKNK